MNKTPKELAEEYSQITKASQDVDLDDLPWSLISEWEAESFLAGYQTAKDELANADKVMFCVFCNDTHKGNCAIGKGKNHPAFNFSKIVVKIESSWISVKDRLPENILDVLILNKENNSCVGYYRSNENDWNMYNQCCSFHMELHDVTHWMLLLKPPTREEL